MALIDEIELAVSSLSTATKFYYADLEEANATIFDRIASGEFPACLVIPADISDTRTSGKVTSTAELNCIFLTKAKQDTLDKPTHEIESEVIAPMRTLAREFVNRLDDSDIIEGNGIEDVVHRSIHQALLDAHLYGCWSVFTINFTEGNSLCPPH